MGPIKKLKSEHTFEEANFIMDEEGRINLMRKLRTDFSPLFCDVLFKALSKPLQETSVGEAVTEQQDIAGGELSPPPSPPQEDPPSPPQDSLGEDVETIDLATSEDEGGALNVAFVTPKRKMSRKMTPGGVAKTPKRWNCHMCGKRAPASRPASSPPSRRSTVSRTSS